MIRKGTGREERIAEITEHSCQVVFDRRAAALRGGVSVSKVGGSVAEKKPRDDG